MARRATDAGVQAFASRGASGDQWAWWSAFTKAAQPFAIAPQRVLELKNYKSAFKKPFTDPTIRGAYLGYSAGYRTVSCFL